MKQLLRSLWPVAFQHSQPNCLPAAGSTRRPSSRGYRVIPAPPPVRVFAWTGCYGGFHLAGAFTDNQFNGDSPFFVNNITTSFGAPHSGAISSNSFDVGSTNILAGGQVGCDLQFAQHWVIGVAGDAAWANLIGSTGQSASFELPGTVRPFVPTQVSSIGNVGALTDVVATLTGRVGYRFLEGGGGGLIYIKGGVAWEDSKYNFGGGVTSTSCNVFSGTSGCVQSSPTVTNSFNFVTPTDQRIGWTAGIGTEWIITGGWSVFGEYDFLDFGTRTVTFTDPILGSFNFNSTQHFNEFKLGFNYRFGLPQSNPYYR